MILYLTSDPGGIWDVNCKPKTRPFKKENNFVKNLRADIKSYQPSYKFRKCLIICASPKDHITNDERAVVFNKSFRRAGIWFSSIEVCDSRNPRAIDSICDYSLVFLLGGHAPTQNLFFETIGLKEKLSEYKGVVLALSAGSMNCAKEVYLLPEEPSELGIPIEERFVPGLGLTDIQIIPHYQYLLTIELEGKKIIEDLVVNESEGQRFVGLCDGSYYRINTVNHEQILFGEAYLISDKKIRPL